MYAPIPFAAPFGELYAVVPPVAVANVVVVATYTGSWYAILVDTKLSTYSFGPVSGRCLGLQFCCHQNWADRGTAICVCLFSVCSGWAAFGLFCQTPRHFHQNADSHWVKHGTYQIFFSFCWH